MSGLGRLSLPERAVAAAVRAPRSTVLAWMLLFGLSGAGLAQLSIETSTSSVLDRQGDEWQFYAGRVRWR